MNLLIWITIAIFITLAFVILTCVVLFLSEEVKGAKLKNKKGKNGKKGK